LYSSTNHSGGNGCRNQAADGINPVNAARTASSRSASVKPRCSCSRATTRSTKTPRFSNGTRSAADQTARSCESVKASMQPWSCRDAMDVNRYRAPQTFGHLKRNGCNLGATRVPGLRVGSRVSGGSEVEFARGVSSRASLRWQSDAFSSPGKTAMTKPSAALHPLRTSSEPDRCSRSFYATLGLCTRHKKVPPLHPASTCLQDHQPPGPVPVS